MQSLNSEPLYNISLLLFDWFFQNGKQKGRPPVYPKKDSAAAAEPAMGAAPHDVWTISVQSVLLKEVQKQGFILLEKPVCGCSGSSGIKPLSTESEASLACSVQQKTRLPPASPPPGPQPHMGCWADTGKNLSYVEFACNQWVNRKNYKCVSFWSLCLFQWQYE